MRVGDFARRSWEKLKEARDDKKVAHPNTWSLPGLIKFAFQAVGKQVRTAFGVDGAKGLLPISGVAAASVRLQRLRLLDFLGAITDRESVVISRHYDATPMRVGFNSAELVDKLAPIARYAIKDTTTGKFKCVPFKETMVRATWSLSKKRCQ